MEPFTVGVYYLFYLINGTIMTGRVQAIGINTEVIITDVSVLKGTYCTTLTTATSGVVRANIVWATKIPNNNPIMANQLTTN